MSTAIPTTLSHEQRSKAFTQALVLEDGLKELESLKARILAGLEKKAEAMRLEHARLMRAAATGANPEAPEQLSMPLVEEVAPIQAQLAAKASPEKDEEPPPEPPKPKGRTRPRKSTPVQTGEKRAEAPASARTSSIASRLSETSIIGDASAWVDALPAPRVPCCECSHSVADHKDGTGKCGGKVKGRPCRCKSFTAVAVELPGAPGWKVRPFKGRLSTGAGGEQAYTLVGEGRETLPLWWVPKYGLAFQNGGAVSSVFSYLGMTATTLEYEKSPAWNWVPREVLRALAEYMGATWPEKPSKDATPATQVELPPDTETLPRMKEKPDHPCACDGCGETFKASELQPVGNAFYCPKCKAEADEQDGDAPAVQAALDDKLRRSENQRKTRLPAPEWTKSLDASALLDAARGPRDPAMEWRDKLEVSGTASACDICGENAIVETPTRARLDFQRWHRPKGGKSWHADKDPRAGAFFFSRWLCRTCATPAKLAEERAATLARLADSAPNAEPSAWRVELPKRNDGHSIIRLWLVNDSTGERKPATWWSGVTALRRSHHLAGRLEGESLSAEMELETWWMANADAVVAPLAEACREGRVPGLKVYEPETLGAGPHKYALSNGWTLEAWEGEGEEPEPSVHFTRPTEWSDIWERVGPFVLAMQGQLTAPELEAADWSAENEEVVREAEDLIARGFILEMRQEVAS